MGVKREEGLWRQLSAGGGLDDSDARVGGDWVVDDAAATASERVGGRGVVWEMVLSGSSGLGGMGGSWVVLESLCPRVASTSRDRDQLGRAGRAGAT